MNAISSTLLAIFAITLAVIAISIHPGGVLLGFLSVAIAAAALLIDWDEDDDEPAF
ncbi:MAG: hypothetical protein HKN01_01620 [Acidimicrobiia bacterium]|nr:hypothetical protein [Acidimicrobiia bacterium]